MILEAILVMVVCGLLVVNVTLWKRVEVLMTAVARLANGHSEHVKWSASTAEDLAGQIDRANERLDEIPMDKFRELAKREEDFVDGLNNILNYSIENYGLNKDGVSHE